MNGSELMSMFLQGTWITNVFVPLYANYTVVDGGVGAFYLNVKPEYKQMKSVFRSIMFPSAVPQEQF